MTKNNFAIIGESRLAQDLNDLCREKGLSASHLSQLTDLAPATPAVIETCAGNDEKKKSILQKLDEFLPPASIIITSCLSYSTTHLGSWVKGRSGWSVSQRSIR